MAYATPAMGNLRHSGAYAIMLTPGSVKENTVPNNVYIDGNTLLVKDGKVELVRGGLQCVSEGSDFWLGHAFVKEVRDLYHDLLWQHPKLVS